MAKVPVTVYIFPSENVVIRSIRMKKMPKLKDLLRAIDVDAITEPYDKALFYFADGGKIHPSAVQEIFGGRSNRQRCQMFSLLNKRSPTIDGLAHSLWEQDPMNERNTTMDYKDAIEQVLQVIVSRAAAARSIIEKYDYETQYEKYVRQSA